jgi:hypothetical protein
MRNIIRFLGATVLLVFLFNCASNEAIIAESFTPIIERKEKAAVMLAYVTHQNYVTPDFSEKSGFLSGSKVNFPDGLVFYFLVKPLKNEKHLVVDEKQIFKINGTDYNTLEDIKGYKILEDGSKEFISINPSIVIYDVKHFIDEEPELAYYFLSKGYISEDSGIYIQKNIICGEDLPRQGLLQYKFSVGVTFDIELEDFELEEFNFELNLSDIK